MIRELPLSKRVCDWVPLALAELGESTGEIIAGRFSNGPGCGLANGVDGAHCVFRTVHGAPMFLSVTPSMIERWRWQWECGPVDGGASESGSLVLEDRHSLNDAIRLLWMSHRGSLPPVEKEDAP